MISRLGAILVAVVATAAIVGLIQRWLGLAPLVLFLAPVAVFLQTAGIGVALAAAVTAALIGDYFFVEPVHHITVHAQGLRLLVVFLLATGLTWLVSRRTVRRAS
jgi:K+-sensing histidine kinase KdpD